jgi:AcrR family transcriptional regulator
VGRWEPNPRLRLVRAAIDLFAEQGYDATTVAQIAERAGLTKATFFRHFPDKREVLFAGQHTHSALLAEGIAGAPADATPLDAVAAGLDVVTASFTPEQREFGPRLRAVTAANPELAERAAFKRAGLAVAIAEALRARGVPDPTADLAGELGADAFHRGFARWTETGGGAGGDEAGGDEAGGDETFAALARAELDGLRAAISALR